VAQVRGNWFPNVRSALDRHGILAATDESLPMTTRNIFWGADAQKWFDEGHAVSIYETVAKLKDVAFCRELGRDAARFAMASTWHDLMQAMIGHLGGTPRMAFEHLPVLWNATRREAGELVCAESSSRHAVTEVRGFPYVSSPAWVQVWLGHHDALLRHLRFTGKSAIELADATTGVVRVRTTWTSPLGGMPTEGFGEPGTS